MEPGFAGLFLFAGRLFLQGKLQSIAKSRW